MIEKNNALLDVVERGRNSAVGMADDVGHVRVAQHSAAGGQHGALKPNDLAASEP
jgi:hypothetical protein